MKFIRSLTGAASLILLAASGNLLAWRQSPFAPEVLACAIAGAVLAVVWIIIRLFQARGGHAVREGREAGALNAALGSLFFLGICVVSYAIVARWDVSVDLTQEGRRELSSQTIQVLQNMDKQVDVFCFFLNVDEPLVRIAREKTVRFLEQCQKHTSLLRVEVKDPQVAVDTMQELGINFASPQGTVVLRSGARKRGITLTGGSPRLEERDFTNALINVLRDAEPRVLYLTGHDERDISDTKSPAGAGGIAQILSNESYKLEPFTIKLGDPVIPAGTDIVVINNPRGDLRLEEVEALDQFVLSGGRILIMLDPWVRVERGITQNENLRPWLQRRFGIEVGSDLVLSENTKNHFMVDLDFEAAPFGEDDPQAGSFRGSYNASHPITRAFDQVMQWQACRTVNVMEAKAEQGMSPVALVRTQPAVWGETDLVRLQKDEQVEKQPDEKTGPLSLAVASSVAQQKGAPGENPRDGRIVVIGNSTFASNSQVTFPGNINFLMNSFAWLTEAEELIAIRPSSKTDPPLLLSQDQTRVVVWVSSLMTTQLVALAGIAMWLWRRRNA
jgi:hypothetical protein